MEGNLHITLQIPGRGSFGGRKNGREERTAKPKERQKADKDERAEEVVAGELRASALSRRRKHMAAKKKSKKNLKKSKKLAKTKPLAVNAYLQF